MGADELAAYIGTTRAGVYKMVSRRSVPFVKIGRSTRFDKAAVDKWIEKNSMPILGEGIGHNGNFEERV
jgi:excisionase family DNA binding protein